MAFTIREENPWLKVLDGLFGSIPIVGIFAGYVFHPAYLVSPVPGGDPVIRVVKKPALLEGRFEIDRAGTSRDATPDVVVVSVLMMLLLERGRG